MKEILVATRNEGKVREIRKVLKPLGLRIRSLKDFQDLPGVKEDGKSFSENALKKARFYAKRSSLLTVSDDSGLEVDALDGRPGIYSARFAGEKASDHENKQKLLREMGGIPPSRRGARFRCAIAIVSPDRREAVVEGECRGRIGDEEKGKRGFGYDPLFYLPRLKKTVSQLTIEEKNKISHRGKALRKLKGVLHHFL